MDYNTSMATLNEEGALLQMDTLMSNLTPSMCNPLRIPSIDEYFTAFNSLGLALFTLGGCAVLIIFSLYIDTVKHLVKAGPNPSKAHSVFVISVYPVVAIATYCAIIVPRAQLVAEAVTQGMFMACLYQLFCLVVSYCNGEAELIKKIYPNVLRLKVPPCCCWPCCILPEFEMTKKHVQALRLLVLQLPVVQGLIYLILLVMWAEEQSLYQVNYNYFQPVIIFSILTGIWGMVMMMRATLPVLKDHQIQGKFAVLQLVLVLAKFQGFIAKMVASSNVFPCRNPITPTVYTNLIYNSVLIWEMVLLCACARFLYKKPLPDEVSPVDSNSNLKNQNGKGDTKEKDKVITDRNITVIRF